MPGRRHHGRRFDENILPFQATQLSNAEKPCSLARSIIRRPVELLLQPASYQLDLPLIFSVAPAIELSAAVVAYGDNERRAMNLGPEADELGLVKFFAAVHREAVRGSG